MAKNIAKTARRQLGGRHLLFGEYLGSWTNLNVHYSIEDKLNIDAGKHVLAMFYPPWPSASVDNTLLDLLNSSYPTRPHSLIANFQILVG